MPAYINKLEQPQHMEGKILGAAPERTSIGTIRVKPSSILWKPRGQRQFYAVPLEKFTAWITSDRTRSERVNS